MKQLEKLLLPSQYIEATEKKGNVNANFTMASSELWHFVLITHIFIKKVDAVVPEGVTREIIFLFDILQEKNEIYMKFEMRLARRELSRYFHHWTKSECFLYLRLSVPMETELELSSSSKKKTSSNVCVFSQLCKFFQSMMLWVAFHIYIACTSATFTILNIMLKILSAPEKLETNKVKLNLFCISIKISRVDWIKVNNL